VSDHGVVLAIIPARGGSKRLPRKNIHHVLGAPMLAWAIRACRSSRHVHAIHVTTDDPAIAAVARAEGAAVIERPAVLAGDRVFKHDAIVHALDVIEARGTPVDLVLSVQANSPELTPAIIDEAIEKLRARDLWEVFTVDQTLVQNGALRVMRAEHARQRTPSVHCGVIIADIIDVHDLDDIAAVEARMQSRGGY